MFNSVFTYFGELNYINKFTRKRSMVQIFFKITYKYGSRIQIEHHHKMFLEMLESHL